ncbi:MAG: phosphomannomutase/phosphoglucomutase [Dokdonella sp.]
MGLFGKTSKVMVQADSFRPLPRRSSASALSALAAATLLIVAAVFCVWQATLVLDEQRAASAGEVARSQAAAAVNSVIDRMRERADAAMKVPALVSALAVEPVDLAQASSLLRAAMPGLAAAEFYGADLEPLISGDLAGLGYARASVLATAQSERAATALLLRRIGGAASLIQGRPALAGDGSVRAYVILRWPAQPVFDAFDRTPASTRLELRQVSIDGEDEVLRAIGPSVVSSGRDKGLVIAGSHLRIHKTPPDLPIVLPHEPILLFVFAALCLGGAVVALWLRHASSRRRLLVPEKRSGKKLPEDRTLTDLVENKVISGIGVRTRASPVVESPVETETAEIAVDACMFRTYDIRGVVGRNLNVDVAQLLGHAIGSEAGERGIGEIVVGRDGRLSGPELSTALIAGIRASGIDVIDIGLAPTPLVYFAGFHLNTGSGVAVTGSHNPPDYNGFKIVLGGETLFGDAITGLHTRIVEGRFRHGNGGLQVIDVGPAYIERVGSDVQVQRRMKVVLDAGNGVAGMLAPQVLEEIGCEVVPLFCEVDGNFPNHHPDPSNPENLKDLIAVVKSSHADVGLAFDGDGDRLGVVTQTGEVIYPDRLLMLFAADMLVRNPGSTVIYDVKCTGKLAPEIVRSGGVPLMWKTGHSLIKAKMRETGAQLAGEMSGHFFFKERWYGFDDGIYAAARLMEILSNDDRPPQQVFNTLYKGMSTPELNIPMKEGETHRFVEEFRKRAKFEGARMTLIDGVRADWPDGWGLVRASNTTPVLVLRFDADNRNALARIQDQFRRHLLALSPKMKLPF